MEQKFCASDTLTGFCFVFVMLTSFYKVQVETEASPSKPLQVSPCSVWWRHICFFCAEPPPEENQCDQPTPTKILPDMDTLISLCASQIIGGHISGSVETFHKIGNNSAIESIVERVYTKDKDLNLVHLIRFAGELHPTQRNIVYVNIYWNMVDTVVDIIRPSFLVMATQWHGENLDANHQIVYKYQIKFLKHFWANEIRKTIVEPYSSYLRQLKEYLSLRCETYLDSVWSEVIEDAYEKTVSNIESILAFAVGTTRVWAEYNYTLRGYQDKTEFKESPICPTHKISIMEALRKQIVEHGHIGTKEFIQLAYYLKAEMERVKTSDRYEGMRVQSFSRYTQIKEKFPWKIQNLVWDGHSCLIMSLTYSEYLYAELPEFNRNYQESGSVFTWISSQPPTKMFWHVESKDIYSIGKNFTIYNVNIGKNLYSKRMNGSSNVYYWIPEGHHTAEEKWIIQPSENGDEFLIKNWLNGRYLSATQDKHDSFRRNVVTSDQKHYWKVEC